MQTSLGLSSDGLEDADLVQGIERAFSIKLMDEELSSCRTVGDLFTLVVRQMPEPVPTAERCASAMSFYRLRRIILDLAPDVTVRPSTLIEVLSKVPVRTLYRRLRRIAGLEAPVPYLSGWGVASAFLALLLPAGLLIAGWPWWSAMLGFLSAVGLYRISPVRYAPAISTFGDLVNSIAARNSATLAAQGARLRPADVWKAFRIVCADHAGMAGGGITPDTLIYAV